MVAGDVEVTLKHSRQGPAFMYGSTPSTALFFAECKKHGHSIKSALHL
jgi:hypothetical protein